MTTNPMTDDQFRWFLTLVTGGVSVIWFISDLRKLIRTGRKDGNDPVIRDQRFGYSMGLFIATIGIVGSCKLNGWISFGGTASAATPAHVVAFDPAGLRKVVEDFSGDVFVLATNQPFADAPKVVVAATTIDPDVLSADINVDFDVTVTLHGGSTKLRVTGVTPRRAKTLGAYMTVPLAADSIDDPTISIGAGLAETLGVKVGDSLPVDVHGVAKSLRIAAIHTTGVADYDFTYGVMNLGTAQALVGNGESATSVMIDLGRDDNAHRVAHELADKLGAGYKVSDWCELNQRLFGCTWAN